MSQQNVYDNDVFFKEYKNIRNTSGNANILIEKPALFSLLPDLNGKTVLDLGCGYGENCVEFINRGAKKVLGIDISEKMLQVAAIDNQKNNIVYKNIPMEEIESIDETFDIIVSSLAVHYIKDFTGLVKNVYRLLNKNGLFVFSQEHPINTCFSNGLRWTKIDDEVIHANLYNYSIDGERKTDWRIDNVIKYHRTFSSIVNSLVKENFIIEEMIEPIPSEEIMEKYQKYRKDIHKPDFLVIRSKKMV